MRHYRNAAAVSLLIHGIVLAVICQLFLRRVPVSVSPPIRVQLGRYEPPVSGPRREPEEVRRDTRPAAEAPVPAETAASAENADDILDFRPRTLPWADASRADKKTVPAESTVRDSILKDHAAGWRQQFNSFSPPKESHDPIDRMLQQRNDGSNPFIAGSGRQLTPKKDPPVRFDFIPSAEQCQALAYLDRHETASQIELYLNLDTTAVTTAEQFNRSLNGLWQKGFLRKKKISPENTLQIITPFGGLPVELSARNRKNPVYEYRMRISKTRLITYLQSRISELQQKVHASQTDSVRIILEIKDLQKKILILI